MYRSTKMLTRLISQLRVFIIHVTIALEILLQYHNKDYNIIIKKKYNETFILVLKNIEIMIKILLCKKWDCIKIKLGCNKMYIVTKWNHRHNNIHIQWNLD